MGGTDVSSGRDLNWRAGREAVSHKVYLGTDSSAVAERYCSPPRRWTDAWGYTPGVPGTLATTYYWKVDEVGDARDL